MPVSNMWFDSMWVVNDNDTFYSFTATINLDGPAYAAAQVSLTSDFCFDTPGGSQSYVTEYSANGNTVDLSNDTPEFVLVQNATSFTFRLDTLNGRAVALMNVFIFD